MRKKLVAGSLIVAICLGVVVTRAVWSGRSALADGDAASERGDTEQAIRWWRRAARWYVPGAPHVGAAYERLEKTARAAEAGGEVAVALAAWRGIRGSILSTRSFYVPFDERLEPANRRIAALMAQQEGPEADPGANETERTNWHYELLVRDDAPSVLWSVIALLGLAIWIGGGALFAVRGVTSEDELVPRIAALAGTMVAVGLLVWMVGLYQA